MLGYPLSLLSFESLLPLKIRMRDIQWVFLVLVILDGSHYTNLKIYGV